jgi:hypothetical protein
MHGLAKKDRTMRVSSRTYKEILRCVSSLMGLPHNVWRNRRSNPKLEDVLKTISRVPLSPHRNFQAEHLRVYLVGLGTIFETCLSLIRLYSGTIRVKCGGR